MRKWIILALLFVLAALIPSFAFADTACQPRYGGGVTCDKNTTVVDKKVKNPQTNLYVNTLDTKGPLFTPTDTVMFRISVTNIGTTALTNIPLVDNFPKYLTHVKGGTWDASKRQVKFMITRLAANETKTFEIEALLSDKETISETASLFCLSNTASTTLLEQTFQDSAQFCIEKEGEETIPSQSKGGLPVFTPQKGTPSHTPKTGAEVTLLLPILGGLGYFLKRRTN